MVIKSTVPVGTNRQLMTRMTERAGRPIEWDASAMRARGCPEADRFIHPSFRKGWNV